MTYKVKYLESVLKMLQKMDKFTSRMIVQWIRKNLENTDNPRVHGKPLSANRKGQWRYRVGDYRIIVEIKDNELIILVINIGHRRDIYIR